MTQKISLILATRNPGKVREISHFFRDLPIVVKSLADYPSVGPIVEDGATFLDNARKKAKAVHTVTGGYVMADDSGLECEDLAGDPGVNSSRYAGPGAMDEENNRRLVEELKGADDPSRKARYVCALVLIDPQGKETVVEETCAGMITFQPGGEGGFGYDPYFFLPEKNCTMAELPLDEKMKISHRGKALKAVYDLLKSRL